MILWFTGQPGSGKTTLVERFIKDKLIGFMKLQPVKIVHIDGDDLREVLDNKDYSEQGRRKNIQFAINMAKVMDDKGYLVLVSLVSPYRDMREKLKSNRNITEFYLHTTEIRGKEDYFVENYEPPINNFVDINTNKSIEECIDEILDVYRQMAAVA
jgi:adenylylsulfate kinase-like enzyme